MPIFRVTTTLAGSAATGGGIARFHFISSATTGALAQAAVDKVRDFWAALTTGFSSELVWTVLGTVDVVDTDDVILSQVGVTSRNGAATGAVSAMPLANQVVARFTTDLFHSGRRVTGHKFIPRPLITTGGSAGPGGTTLAQAQAAVTALVAPAADPSFSILSRVAGAAANVQSGSIVTKWGILRSRRD